MAAVTGILFDKDGTLFDFHATWSVWAEGLLRHLAGGDAGVAQSLADAIGFRLADPAAGVKAEFLPASVVIAGTPEVVAAALLPLLPGQDAVALVDMMNARAALAPQAPAVPLRPLLQGLRGRGLRLGLATNDGEEPALAHLAAAGISDLFDFVAGYDSGHGAKPEPGQLLAFARAFGLDPGAVVMVGDSTHDLIAGRRAGMRTLAVLTGLAGAHDLAPHADAVLPDIGAIPDWLDQHGG